MSYFKYNDGGRAASGRKGHTGDCVCRAICIVTGKAYEEVYNTLAEGYAHQRINKYIPKAGMRTASHGIHTHRKWFKDYMKELGFKWTPTMLIGTGCRVHLHPAELPKGRIIVMVSKHVVAMINGILNDTFDHSRGGTRCVYGYWRYCKRK